MTTFLHHSNDNTERKKTGSFKYNLQDSSKRYKNKKQIFKLCFFRKVNLTQGDDKNDALTATF
jgi:hypothetical protein